MCDGLQRAAIALAELWLLANRKFRDAGPIIVSGENRKAGGGPSPVNSAKLQGFIGGLDNDPEGQLRSLSLFLSSPPTFAQPTLPTIPHLHGFHQQYEATFPFNPGAAESATCNTQESG